MTIVSDVTCDEPQAPPQGVAAVKLHVLQLEPIKARMGEKWERLSTLVHKLFEKTLRQAQGPRDHFLLVDEMSYVVTFHNLSLEEASLACVAVARKVCELLFGAEVDDISVRNLVGMVPPALLQEKTGAMVKIAEVLERQGEEIIVTPRSADPGWRGGEKARTQAVPAWRPEGWIARAQAQGAAAGIQLAFFPVWDIKNRRSASLFLSAYTGEKARLSVRRALQGAPETAMVDMEIALLNAAAEYAHRVHAAQKLCAVGVGVSYQTLSGFHSRIQYIGALKAVQTIPTSPLLVRIEQVPAGTPLGRLAEIVAMLCVPNARVTVEFQSLRALPALDIRLGAVGLGGSLKGCDSAAMPAVVQKLARRAAEQRAFMFLDELDSAEMLELARSHDVRFGSGSAIDSSHAFSGHEPVPDFPLQR